MPISFTKTWADANAYCTGAVINGQTGWRLPTKDELLALYHSRAMNDQGWTLDYTWSSTPDRAGFHYEAVLLDVGAVNPVTDMYYNYVTCVR